MNLVTPLRLSLGGLLAVSLAACVVEGKEEGSGGAQATSTATTTTEGQGGDTGQGGASSSAGQGGATSSTGQGGATSSSSSGAGGGAGGSGGGGPTAGWTIHSHSCDGANRTDALLVEDDGTMWVGCGTNTGGTGLHRSTDGGVTWAAVKTKPSNMLNSFRINGIARGDDGLLYAAGTGNSTMVVSLDTTSSPMPLKQVLVPGGQIGQSFTVGTLSVLSEGRIFVESETGHDALYRPSASTSSAAADWTDASAWTTDGKGYQMMGSTVYNGRLYGSGATISEPPYVFLPARESGAEVWKHEVVKLSSFWKGELWGIAAGANKVVAVGVDQLNHVGKILVSGADPYVADDYTEHDLPDIVGEGDPGTWARGTCLRGDRVVVVGERQPLAAHSGLVMLSDDGGATFKDITPKDDVTGSVSKCHIAADNTVTVAGGTGFIGIYR